MTVFQEMMKRRVPAGTLVNALIRLVYPPMVFAPVYSAACVMQETGREALVRPASAASFLILLIPSLTARRAAEKVRSYAAFLGIAAAVLAGVWFLAALAGGMLPLHGGAAEGGSSALMLNTPLAFRVFMLAESLLIISSMHSIRMREAERQQALRSHDLAWKERIYLLEEPTWFFAGWFAFWYVCGLLFRSPALSNISAIFFIVYGVMTAYSRHAARSRTYMKQLDYVSHMPVRRIRMIGGVMTGAIALIFACAAAVVFLGTARFRFYTDIREWRTTPNMEATYDMLWDQMQAEATMQEAQLDFLAEEAKMNPVVGKMLEIFVFAIFIGFLAFLVVFGVKALKNAFRQFRDGINENGDISESIEADVVTKIRPARRRRADRSLREQIRREYRKAIRKAMKRMPDPASTPTEIETAAGIAGEPEMVSLHARYEEARYDLE